MGSLCQTKPAVTNTTQTYTPAGQSGMQDIYNRVAQAASNPYNPYTGQLVAGLNETQQAGINNVNAAYGAAQPYYNQAQQYATAGASAITPEQIQAYQNPYTQQVVNATQANFNETNAQQQSAQRGNAALKGALGGDRAGVAQAELSRQQNLAQQPIIANLYQQGYDKSLAAAQADRAAQAQGAYTFGSLGSAAQNSQLQGAQAQIGAGTVAQQNQQQQLGADYQQYLNAQAFPYQQAQFLASYGMPALQGQGGTTTGQQTQQQAQASPFSQALGVGLTAAGLFSGNPFMAMSGAGSLFGGGSSGAGQGAIGTYNGGGSNPWMSNGSGMTWWADGGRVNKSDGGAVNQRAAAINPYFASGGFLDSVRSIRSALREHYAEGGIIGSPYRGGISGIESSGRYDALGPRTKTGDQALGKYQIMGANLPEWSRAALGREVSRDEFIKSPQLQDAIFDHRFGQYVNKYGPSGAAKAWFAGEGGMNNPNARDSLGTSVADYERKFNTAMGIPDGDRQKLASMAGGANQSASQMLMDKYAPSRGGSDNMNARNRAIALGLSMIAGGGGSGFADGGVPGGGTNYIPKSAELPFADRAEGVFSPFDTAGGATPNERVQEGFEAQEGAGSPYPGWFDKSATGQPYELEDDTPPPPNNDASQGQIETAQGSQGEQPHDEISGQTRMDPYRVYQQNLPQGSSGDDMRQALIAAGLGILGGKSSNALTNIGEGGLKGVQQYNASKKQRESAELVARRMMQQAEQFNQSLDLKNQQFLRQQDVDAQKERMFDRRLQQQSDRDEARIKLAQDREDARLAAAQRKEEERQRAEAGKKVSKEEEAMFKNDLKRIDSIRKETENSQSHIDAAEKGLAALPGASTGLAKTLTPGVLQNSATQSLDAAINQLTLDSGQKMKGSFSDKDIEFLKAMLGGKYATPDTIKRSLESVRASAMREKMRGEFYQDYLEANKSLRGADASWNRYIEQNPIIKRKSDDDIGFTINAPAATADYSGYLRQIPRWVPRDAKGYDPEKKTYIDKDGNIQRAE